MAKEPTSYPRKNQYVSMRHDFNILAKPCIPLADIEGAAALLGSDVPMWNLCYI